MNNESICRYFSNNYSHLTRLIQKLRISAKSWNRRANTSGRQDNPDDISVIPDSYTEYDDISDDISLKFEYIEYDQDNPDDISVISNYDTKFNDISVISNFDSKCDNEYNDNQYDFDISTEYI